MITRRESPVARDTTEPYHDFYGRIIGWIRTLPDGTKIAYNFYRQELGRYDPITNTTRRFARGVMGRGDLTSGLILEWETNYQQQKNKR